MLQHWVTNITNYLSANPLQWLFTLSFTCNYYSFYFDANCYWVQLEGELWFHLESEFHCFILVYLTSYTRSRYNIEFPLRTWLIISNPNMIIYFRLVIIILQTWHMHCTIKHLMFFHSPNILIDQTKTNIMQKIKCSLC